MLNKRQEIIIKLLNETYAWTTPPIISEFLSSGWQGAVLQFILIIIGIIIYYPFIKSMDKNYLKEEKKV